MELHPSRNTPHRRHARGVAGFTLIELMIVVVIVSLLAVVAYPSYRNYVARSQRTLAKAALLDIASRQESYFLNRKRYADITTDLGLPTEPGLLSEDGQYLSSDEDPDLAYNLSLLVNASRTTYTVLATPQGLHLSDPECNILTLSSTGRKGVSGGTKSATYCW